MSIYSVFATSPLPLDRHQESPKPQIAKYITKNTSESLRNLNRKFGGDIWTCVELRILWNSLKFTEPFY